MMFYKCILNVAWAIPVLKKKERNSKLTGNLGFFFYFFAKFHFLLDEWKTVFKGITFSLLRD